MGILPAGNPELSTLISPGAQLSSLFQQGCEDLAITAALQLVMSARLNGAFTFGSTEKPTQMPALKFPSWTRFLLTALFLFPTRDQVLLSVSLIAEKKKNLSFDMGWNCPSTLLITMDGFNGNTEQISQLFLGPAEFLSCWNKFIFVHTVSSFQIQKEI
jgi:hypothetical protein